MATFTIKVILFLVFMIQPNSPNFTFRVDKLNYVLGLKSNICSGVGISSESTLVQFRGWYIDCSNRLISWRDPWSSFSIYSVIDNHPHWKMGFHLLPKWNLNQLSFLIYYTHIKTWRSRILSPALVINVKINQTVINWLACFIIISS